MGLMPFILLPVKVHSFLLDYNLRISNTPLYHSSRPGRHPRNFTVRPVLD